VLWLIFLVLIYKTYSNRFEFKLILFKPVLKVNKLNFIFLKQGLEGPKNLFEIFLINFAARAKRGMPN